MINDTIFRENAEKFTLIRLDSNSVNAMGASVVELDPVVPVLAADQQQEINGSRDPECLLTKQSHRMKKEPQSHKKFIGVFRQVVSFICRVTLKRQKPEPGQHLKAAIHLLNWDIQGRRGIFGTR